MRINCFLLNLSHWSEQGSSNSHLPTGGQRTGQASIYAINAISGRRKKQETVSAFRGRKESPRREELVSVSSWQSDGVRTWATPCGSCW